MEVLAVIEDGLNSPIAGVLIGGAITLIAQRMAARASLREQKSMLFAREKVQHYYRINDLLFELDEALSSYASAPVRPGENLSDDEMRERDMQGVEALEKIINYGVDHMIYISCKPTSLARDLEVLLARGYVVDKVQCVDMFPNTVHVETVVGLHRKDM